MFALLLITVIGFCIYRVLSREVLAPELSTAGTAAIDRGDNAKRSGQHAATDGDLAARSAAPAEDGQGESWIVLNERPHIAYQQFLDRAKAGDESAQLMLSEILTRCRHSSVQTPQELAALEGRGDMPAELLAHYRAKLEECGGLYRLLGEYDLDSLWAFWVEQASEKLPVAQLALSLERLEVEYSDELYRQLQDGIMSARGDWIQERLARQLAFSFFRTFIEPTQYDASVQDSGYHMRGEDSLAWDYLQCMHSADCDLTAFEEQASNHYYEYQVDDMYKRAAELERALQQADWARLGLQRKLDE